MMLPSTGYFKGLRCPFYDNGFCERPHCHFRHVKRDSVLAKSCDGNETVITQTISLSGVESTKESVPTVLSNDNGILTNISTSKATYNPTPIAELNKVNTVDSVNGSSKRHIPVPYTPRKPTGLPLKRPIETEVQEKLTYIPPAKYQPGSSETQKLDPYTPSGSTISNDNTIQYLPGTQTVLQEYKPAETNNSSKISYVPSDAKTVSKKKILEYEPAKIKPKAVVPTVTYNPTPKSFVPCFSSDEEEPVTKKGKLSSDMNELDDLGAEFDILDQILDEEKDKENSSKITCHKKEENENNNRPDSIITNEEKPRKHKDDKNKNHSSNRESSSSKTNNNKEKHRQHVSSQSDKHIKSSSSSDKKTDHKSSEKHKDKLKDKSKTNEKKGSSNSRSKSKERDKKEVKKKDKERSEQRTKEREKARNKDGETKDKYSGKNKAKESNESDSNRSQEKHSKNHVKERDKYSSKDKERNSKSSNSGDKSKHKSSHSSLDKDKHKSNKSHKKQSKDLIKPKKYDSDDSINRNELECDIQIDSEELIEEISESDEEAIALECKKIFEEYVPQQKPVIQETTTETDQLCHIEYVPTKKRISLAVDKNIKVTHKPAIKPDFKVSAAQTMAERLAKVKEYHATKVASIENNSNELKINDLNKSIGNSKIRIAHVPYASSLMSARKNITPASVPPKIESCSSTSIQTIKKGATRVAHLPNDKFIDRPGVLEPLASKIPANIRSTYLNMMIDECLKIYLTAPDAYARAQHEELNTSKKCKAIQIYKNSALLAVSRLRREYQECNGIKKSASDCKTLQSLPSTDSWSVQNKNRRNSNDPNELRGERLYENISKWILTEEQLRENGFPRPHPNGGKGRAMIYAQNRQKPPKGFIRTCCRCKKDYTIDKKGFAVIKEECIYHPNNKYRFRGEVKYQCCSQDGMSDGCCMAPSHVYEYVDFENLSGFVTTMLPNQQRADYGVYSLDCEMCYTTHGLDLTRITVIDSSCKVVYETLIKPLHPIIDYNTRYSGITEEQMAGVKTTLLDVQATLLTMFSSKTILIGHSLESDFKALKLIHDTVIDTSVLYPHKMGPPYKRALRNLSSEHLKKIIQNSVEGHDSAEDATVCMELIHYKLKEDLKTR